MFCEFVKMTNDIALPVVVVDVVDVDVVAVVVVVEVVVDVVVDVVDVVGVVDVVDVVVDVVAVVDVVVVTVVVGDVLLTDVNQSESTIAKLRPPVNTPKRKPRRTAELDEQ